MIVAAAALIPFRPGSANTPALFWTAANLKWFAREKRDVDVGDAAVRLASSAADTPADPRAPTPVGQSTATALADRSSMSG